MLEVHNKEVLSIANRIAYALLLCAFFVCSTMMLSFRVPPVWGDTSLPGVCFFCVAAWMSIINMHNFGKF